MKDIENLEDEFNNFFESKNSCVTNCDDSEEEYPSFFEELISIILVPNRCGLYFSRFDLKIIASACGEQIMIRERKRMLKDILKSILSQEDIEQLFIATTKMVDAKVDTYRSLIEHYPSTHASFKEFIQKSDAFKERLKRIEHEFEAIINVD